MLIFSKTYFNDQPNYILKDSSLTNVSVITVNLVGLIATSGFRQEPIILEEVMKQDKEAAGFFLTGKKQDLSKEL